MLHLLAYFLITFLLAFFSTPLIRWIALKFGILAYPNHRTIHQGAIPKLGGGAFIFAFIIGILVVVCIQPERLGSEPGLITSLILGAAVLFVLGTFDDKFELDCNLKLSVEIAVAIFATLSGWRFDALILPDHSELYLRILSYPISALWIVGIINAVNMIDGLDGLASGITLVVTFFSMTIAGLFDNTMIITLCVLLSGAVAGFLRYNINPASIFMGDSGSLSLGFLLACISLHVGSVAPGKVAIMVTVLLLGLPLTDTALAIIRRVRRGIHPFHADKDHIHHRLVRLGMSPAGAAMFMIGLSFIIGIMALLFAQDLHTDFRLFGQL